MPLFFANVTTLSATSGADSVHHWRAGRVLLREEHHLSDGRGADRPRHERADHPAGHRHSTLSRAGSDDP